MRPLLLALLGLASGWALSLVPVPPQLEPATAYPITNTTTRNP